MPRLIRFRAIGKPLPQPPTIGRRNVAAPRRRQKVGLAALGPPHKTRKAIRRRLKYHTGQRVPSGVSARRYPHVIQIENPNSKI